MERHGKPVLPPGGSFVVGIPRSTSPFLVDVTSATSRTRYPAEDLGDSLAHTEDTAVFANVFSVLGHLKHLPPGFRDLMVEYSVCNAGRTAARTLIPSRMRANDNRWEFDPFGRDLWTAAGRLGAEIRRRGLTQLYQEIDLPYVRLLFDAATRGVLVDGGELERSPNAQELKPILRRRDLRTGRVRSSYRWSLPGRAYANRPSLQNLHREDRRAVVAPPGHRLVYADLRAADLAALAGLSGDRNLLAQFEPGEDIHAFTARLAAGSGSPERNIGKALNLASLYGAGTSAIAEKGRMTYDEAGRFEKKFWSTIRRAREWCDGVFVRVLEPPHELRNPFGRLACFGLDVADGIDLDTLRRRVISFAVSSTASDAFKVNLLRLAGVLPQGAHVVLPMHDGVLLEVPDEELERVVKACFKEMTVPISQVPIPLGVKVEVGANWGETERI